MAVLLKTIPANVAQQRAQEFLRENELIRFSVGAPRRMVSALRSVWSVPVELRYPDYGLVGQVGIIAVDEETGNVVAWTPRTEMLTTAGELYCDQRKDILKTRRTMPAEDPRHPLIYQREGAAGYEPAIRDTGVRVRAIVQYNRLQHGDIGAILESVRHISPEQVRAALAYYDDHADEIDFFIAESGGEYLEYVMREWERRQSKAGTSTEPNAQ
ncbi:MAG: hypothetical protein B6D41_00040 [Chloroflexi bacterium UTCFX4]|jgi:uncharacterized protein (DUF433 family)|nr:MAG: hypothetical protein B6D41_00040 [Chloroflexi bacterium UTCFX4]